MQVLVISDVRDIPAIVHLKREGHTNASRLFSIEVVLVDLRKSNVRLIDIIDPTALVTVISGNANREYIVDEGNIQHLGERGAGIEPRGLYLPSGRGGGRHRASGEVNGNSQSALPRDVVKRFYDGGARGEITSFHDSLAEDFGLFVPPQLPWGGTFDKKQYIALLPRVADVLDFSRLTYLSLTSEGAHVVALIKIGVSGKDDSIIISEHWDIRDGKAIRLLVAYFDPTSLLDQIHAAAA